MRRIVVFDDEQTNVVNSRVVEIDNVFLFQGDRDDFELFKSFDELQKPGVYVLLNDTQVYVGQSGTNLYRRLMSHYKSKPWWSKIVCFGLIDGYLSKSQTEYLERVLIQLYRQTSFALMDNATVGNNGYIDRISQLKADKVWMQVSDVLDDVLHIDLFDYRPGSGGTVLAKSFKNEALDQVFFVVQDRTSQRSFNSSGAASSLLYDFVKYYYDHENLIYRQRLLMYKTESEPSSVEVLGSKAVYVNNEVKTVVIDDDEEVYLYLRLNVESTVAAMYALAEVLGVDISIEWV